MSRYHTKRQAAIEELGGECVRCGTTEDLQFDHIDPTTKTQKMNAVFQGGDARLVEELAKCQLLCISCHSTKTQTERWTQCQSSPC